MKDIIYEFLDYLTLEKKYSNYTEKNYEIDLFKYDSFLKSKNKNFLKVKYKDISEYVMFLKKSNYLPASINRNLSAIRSFYNFLEINSQMNYNPFDLIKGVKGDKKLPNYFKYDEFNQMLNILEDTPLDIRNRLILELFLATGVRVSELVNIKVNDLDMKNYEIKVLGKGQKERIVFFGSYAVDAINNYLANSRTILLGGKMSNALFINNNGTELTDRGVRLIIENIIKKSSVTSKVSPHTFRHTFATMLLNEGCSIKSVQELLGHASLNTTSIYTHLTNDEVRRVYLNSHPRAKE